MSNSKINYSIIVPHHNIPNLLERCLVSIPRRNDIQIIVVDDNSSPEIVNFDNFPGLNDPYVEVYLTKEGKGAGYARNVGLQHARGKWILFADADDFFVENAFVILEEYMNSKADLILFKADSVNSDTLQPAYRNVRTNDFIDKYFEGKMSDKDVAIYYNVPWCKQIKREYIEKYNLKFDEIFVSNDVMFATKVACNTNKIEISFKSIYCNTFRVGSLWSSQNNMDIRIRTYIRRNKYLLENGYKNIIPPLLFVNKYCNQSFKVYMKCFLIIISQGVLFQGMKLYISKKIKNILNF